MRGRGEDGLWKAGSFGFTEKGEKRSIEISTSAGSTDRRLLEGGVFRWIEGTEPPRGVG